MLGCIRAQVAEAAVSIMGASVPEDQPLMEAGLDSLGAVDLRNALGTQFALELPATFTFDHPTVAAMAAHISASVAPEISTAVQPHWRDNALVQHDFGAPTSSAVQLVGLSCVYPGLVSAFSICLANAASASALRPFWSSL